MKKWKMMISFRFGKKSLCIWYENQKKNWNFFLIFFWYPKMHFKNFYRSYTVKKSNSSKYVVFGLYLLLWIMWVLYKNPQINLNILTQEIGIFSTKIDKFSKTSNFMPIMPISWARMFELIWGFLYSTHIIHSDK